MEAEGEPQSRFVARADGYRQELAAALVIGRKELGIKETRRVSRKQIHLTVTPGDESIVVANVGRNKIGLQRGSGSVVPLAKDKSARVSAAHLPAILFLSQVRLALSPRLSCPSLSPTPAA